LVEKPLIPPKGTWENVDKEKVLLKIKFGKSDFFDS